MDVPFSSAAAFSRGTLKVVPRDRNQRRALAWPLDWIDEPFWIVQCQGL